jgi:hypothetical protein
MRILGVDFSSAPSRRKPIAFVAARLDGTRLCVEASGGWTDFAGFERALAVPGPWAAGFDFPFGQPRRLVEGLGWPQDWAGYVAHAAGLGRQGFRAALEAYKAPRPQGDREHRRRTDPPAGAISPQKLYGVPVALMFLEGAPRLLRAGVSVPHLHPGDPARLAFEAYPGVAARRLIGRASYKSDDPSRQSPEQAEARRRLVEALVDSAPSEFGLRIEAPAGLAARLAEDPAGDALDALIAAVQAGWALTQGAPRHGAPPHVDPLEGWIADPAVSAALSAG